MNETRPTSCPCCGEPIPECVAHEVEVGVVYSCPACRQLVYAIPGAVDEGAHFISEEDREALRSLRAAQREEREESLLIARTLYVVESIIRLSLRCTQCELTCFVGLLLSRPL